MKDRDAEKELIKERVRIEELVREVVPDLEARGNELWACCPFHAEDTPSFHIRPALGAYYCFGCNAKGDVISFVMQTRGVGFLDALTLLAFLYMSLLFLPAPQAGSSAEVLGHEVGGDQLGLLLRGLALVSLVALLAVLVLAIEPVRRIMARFAARIPLISRTASDLSVKFSSVL